LRSSAVRSRFKYFSFSGICFPDRDSTRYNRPSQSVGLRHLIRSLEGTQSGFLPQAASTRAANSLVSSRRAGSDQASEDGRPASGSASEEEVEEDSEEEEL
jgi:hypothetical protein